MGRKFEELALKGPSLVSQEGVLRSEAEITNER